MSEPTPNPGSVEAIRRGCTCPVLENGRGRGCGHISNDSGTPHFWMNEGCPLHGKPQVDCVETVHKSTKTPD